MSVNRTQSDAAVDGGREDGRTGEDSESLTVSMFGAIVERQETPDGPPIQLYDHIDTDALEQLVTHAETHAESDWKLTFSVEDADVTVTSGGELTVQ